MSIGLDNNFVIMEMDEDNSESQSILNCRLINIESGEEVKNEIEEEKVVENIQNTSLKCPTIEGTGSKVIFEPMRLSQDMMNKEIEVRLSDFKSLSVCSSVSLQDPPSDIEFEWDEKVTKEYKKNLRKLLGWEIGTEVNPIHLKNPGKQRRKTFLKIDTKELHNGRKTLQSYLHFDANNYNPRSLSKEDVKDISKWKSKINSSQNPWDSIKNLKLAKSKKLLIPKPTQKSPQKTENSLRIWNYSLERNMQPKKRFSNRQIGILCIK